MLSVSFSLFAQNETPALSISGCSEWKTTLRYPSYDDIGKGFFIVTEGKCSGKVIKAKNEEILKEKMSIRYTDSYGAVVLIPDPSCSVAYLKSSRRAITQQKLDCPEVSCPDAVCPEVQCPKVVCPSVNCYCSSSNTSSGTTYPF